MKILLILAIVVYSAVLPACVTATSTKMNLALNRATFDLNCPRNQMKIIDLSNDAYGITGCGQRATYVVQCQDQFNSSTCRAILNSSKKPE